MALLNIAYIIRYMGYLSFSIYTIFITLECNM